MDIPNNSPLIFSPGYWYGYCLPKQDYWRGVASVKLHLSINGLNKQLIYNLKGLLQELVMNYFRHSKMTLGSQTLYYTISVNFLLSMVLVFGNNIVVSIILETCCLGKKTRLTLIRVPHNLFPPWFKCTFLFFTRFCLRIIWKVARRSSLTLKITWNALSNEGCSCRFFKRSNEFCISKEDYSGLKGFFKKEDSPAVWTLMIYLSASNWLAQEINRGFFLHNGFIFGHIIVSNLDFRGMLHW